MRVPGINRGAVLGVIAVAILSALAARPAMAQGCSVSGTTVAFGSYLPQNAAATTSTGTVTVTCQALVSLLVGYTIFLTTGGSGSFHPRAMANIGPKLSYQLYLDNGYSQIWGDGTSGTSTVSDGYLITLLAPYVKMYTVYGSVPAGQLAAPGGWSDTITVMIIY